MNTDSKTFGFKQLEIWHDSIDFADLVFNTLEKLDTNSKHYRLIEQVESCTASVCANIAEGKGRSSKKEYIRFLYISRGSLYETISFLNLFAKRKWIHQNELENIESKGLFLARRIKSLINAINRSM